MSPKRGERAASPPVGEEYDIRFGTGAACSGWEQLATQSPANLRRAFDSIRSEPRSRASPGRQHRLKGALGSAQWKGATLERWQFEVAGAGRIWYLIDDDRRTAWIVHAGPGHPKATD